MQEDPGTRAALSDLCTAFGIVGAQIALLTPDGPESYTFGAARSDPHMAMTPTTGIQIGSTSKLYTAILMMQLVDAGLVDLDRPVATYLPGVELGIWTDTPAAELITPRMLMSMSSGLDNGRYVDTGDERDAVEKAVGLVAMSALTFAPGTFWAYTNASTNVSGLIVERLTGLPWDRAVQELLLDPAGLGRTTADPRRQIVGPTAVGHMVTDAGAEVIDHRGLGRGFGPTGSTITSTAEDLLGLAALFLGDGVAWTGRRILSPEAAGLMQSPQVAVTNATVADSWGLGPWIRQWDGRRVLGHPGMVRGGGSQVHWVPESGSALAIVCNVPAQIHPFSEAVLDFLLPERLGIRKPRARAPIGTTVDNPADYAGEYVRDAVRMRVDADGGRLRVSVSSTHEAGIGAVAKVEEFGLLPLGDDLFRFVTSDGTELGPWDRAFVRDPAGKVSHLLDPFFAARRTDR
ncbi:serine hydrolase [Jiangella anatolica]|nr:serine hydrolase [Jiangella anatolica]